MLHLYEANIIFIVTLYTAEFHPPCPGLSVKSVSQSGAEPVDPKSLVEDWVKTVDTVTSGMDS